VKSSHCFLNIRENKIIFLSPCNLLKTLCDSIDMTKRLLAFQIDGVESLNNVLLIGMTNRKDLLDEALLRLLPLSFSVTLM